MSVPHRWLLLGSTAAVLVALGVTQAAAGRPAGRPAASQPVSVVETVASHTPSVSGDGSLVAYAGAPTSTSDLRASTVYLKDRVAGTVVELSPVQADVPAGESVWPVLSADGCSVTFLTEMGYDLFRDDDVGTRWDVYRQTLPACGGTLGDLELISSTLGTGISASAADDVVPTDPPAVSADGTIVAYTHRFSVAAPDLTAVLVVDLAVPLGGEGRSAQVVGTPAGSPNSTFLHSGLRQPSLSADGNVVAFTSDADSAAAVPVWGDGPVPGGAAFTNVYVWDRANPDRATSVRLVSSAGGAITGNADSPSVSGDGRFVAFASTASNLVAGATLPPCVPTCLSQVYLFGREDGSLRLVSRAPGDPAAPAVAADAGASQPALGVSGGEVVFVSRATNLLPTRSVGVGGPTDGDIVVAMPATGEVRRASVLADGVTPAPAANAHPRLSNAGRVIVFDTLAGQAFGADSVQARQVAILDRAPVVELADLDVGAVAVGFPGPEWFLVLTNRGPSSFVPATVTVSDPDFIISGGTCVDSAGLAVGPGEKCTVHLMLMPSVAGPRTATLTVAEAGYQAISVTAQLSGRGGDPTLAPTPSGGYGGSQVVGTAGEPMPFTFEAVALSSVRIVSLQLTGEHPQDYAVTLDECTGARIAAGSTCNLQVTFTPTAAGRRTATVIATTTDGAYATILVSGDGHYAPTLAASETSFLVGSRLTLTGAGYAPSVAVTIGWADGSGRTTTVTTDAAGGFVSTLLIRATDRAGERTLVAQTADGQVAAVALRVLPKGSHFGPGSPAWPGA